MKRNLIAALALFPSLLLATASVADTPQQRAPSGWLLAGSSPASYESGADDQDVHANDQSAFLRSTEITEGFGTLMQQFDAKRYRGKRVQLSGFVKTQDVADGWAGLWMRVDDANGRTAEFDNMYNRRIAGSTEWTRHSIVLDVPEGAHAIAFGVLLISQGEVRVDGLSFEVVDDSVVPTSHHDGRPQNLGFEG